MTNEEPLAILQQGTEIWNAWRKNTHHLHIPYDIDLTGENLQEMDLRRVNFIEVDLRGATLSGSNLGGASLENADLRDAYLIDTNLVEADLDGADLRGACLWGADLRKACLHFANLSLTDFKGANLSEVRLRRTTIGATNFADTKGLDTCKHNGPSYIDYFTMDRSGPINPTFLRGCGLSDWEIEVTKLYDPGLTAGQVNEILYRIYPLRTDPLIQFYSCFISYASKDQAFAERLYADLQNKGVRCWFAPEDMKIGARIRDTIDQQIHLREKLLIVLSSASIVSSWVEDEVEAALEEERTSQERRTVLVPIKIDHTVEETTRTWARQIKRTRHIGDFTHWEDDDAYQKALNRLLRDLNTTARQS
jgi:uncharacterized protein YjbI with pentapeptide repeats